MGSVNLNSEDKSVDLVLLKKEVDALQIAIHGQKSPWYKNMATILSVVALLFSFGTTYVSNKRIESQDIQNARVELRALLQKLSTLPREEIEILIKYEKDYPENVESIRGLTSQEKSLLTNHALDIIKKLPAESITSAEYFGMASALEVDFNNSDAELYYKKAINASTRPNLKIAALCGLGNLLINTGKPDQGRAYYQKALNTFSDFKNYNYGDTEKFTQIWSMIRWAYSEASIGSFDIALNHISTAENYLPHLPPSPRKSQLESQLQKIKIDFNKAIYKPKYHIRPLRKPIFKKI